MVGDLVQRWAPTKKRDAFLQSLESAVRAQDNLYRAWTIVRGNVLAAGREEFKAQVQEIAENPIPHLRRIQDQLQRRRFKFAPQEGVFKAKPGGKKRQIVVSPIPNRIVQRAVLNILQSDRPKIVSQLGTIPDVIRTATSVGGVPERGVQNGVFLVKEAIAGGATHFFRSDIQEFFTRVPKKNVLAFVKNETHEKGFVDLLEQALSTELENEDEIKELLHLFPIGDVGVPQGSSLSTFAGNVVLREFDQQMNGRNITTIRYIDDFIILGPKEASVRKAFKTGVSILDRLGMDAYRPEENPGKAEAGKILNGFDFLGCRISPNGVIPSKSARVKLLADVDHTLAKGCDSISTFCSSDDTRRAEESYIQTLVRLDRLIRGWGDAFRFANQRLPFKQMDQQIDQKTRAFSGWANRILKGTAPEQRRRAFGIALLSDTPRIELSDTPRIEDRGI